MRSCSCAPMAGEDFPYQKGGLGEGGKVYMEERRNDAVSHHEMPALRQQEQEINQVLGLEGHFSELLQQCRRVGFV